MGVITLKLIDLTITLLGVGALLLKFRTPKGSLSQKELIQEIERRDEEITKLKLEIQAWKFHHEHLTNN